MALNRIKLVLIALFVFANKADAQILHTESFSVILDTTKVIQGSILPDFKFQNLKNDLLEFENIADMSIRIKKNAFTLANKFVLSKFGNQVINNGGYLYLEFRRIESQKMAIESYAQVHWAEARGLERKYALGVNFRLRVLTEKTIGLYAGIGPFYEYERWNYNGVSNDSLIPAAYKPIETNYFKIGSYISVKFEPIKRIFFDISVYCQAQPEFLFTSPRFASCTKVTYNITEHIGFSVNYRNVYDPSPVVPVSMLFNQFNSGVSINF